MYKRIFLLAGVLFFGASCKKEPVAPASIYGKWFFGKVNSKLYNGSGKLLDSVSQSGYTSNDFVYYYSDGTGYYSNTSKISLGASLSLFTFTIKGSALTQTGSSQSFVLNETVTSLTITTLAIHAEYELQDPNNVEQTDKEVDDISYHR